MLERSANEACLVAFDEFARTTGSEEAEALLSEAVGRFAAAGRCTALFATHFGRIERGEAVHWLRMAGLDRKAARERLNAADAPADSADSSDGAAAAAANDARLRDINRLMRYEILEDGASDSDALEIATLLGLDRSLVDGARKRLAMRRGGVRGEGGEDL
jgi:DNA mismatch repair ATPase MutS